MKMKNEFSELMEDKGKNDITNLRRTQLMRAAYKVVSRKGYYNFTIKDIGREAGLSTGLIHYYFKDKQDLLLTLLKEINKNLKTYLNRDLGRSTNPEEKLGIFIDQAFDLVEKEKDYFYVLIDFWTQINHNERMRKANIKLFQSYREECLTILKEGVEKGNFRNLDINYMSTVIISLIQGTIIQYVIDNNAFPYKDYTEKIKNQIFQMILKIN